MSTLITTLAVAAMISLTGWQPAVAAEHNHKKDTHASQLLGAWSQISIDEEVMNVAYFSASILSDGQLKNVLSAKQQLVAGTNYALLLEMNNEHQWEVIVYGRACANTENHIVFKVGQNIVKCRVRDGLF
jgi:hypothetical protein